MPKSSTAKPSAKTRTTGVKKAPAKKAATNRRAKADGRVLVCADPEHCFWTNDGQILANLTELRDALAGMSDDLFRYHVTKERNDFADWVEQVLLDAACAADLRKRKTKKTAHTVVVTHLKTYAV